MDFSLVLSYISFLFVEVLCSSILPLSLGVIFTDHYFKFFIKRLLISIIEVFFFHLEDFFVPSFYLVLCFYVSGGAGTSLRHEGEACVRDEPHESLSLAWLLIVS